MLQLPFYERWRKYRSFQIIFNAIFTAQNITPHLPNQVLPVCLAGGGYTLNVVGAAPTCNMPGHILAQ